MKLDLSTGSPAADVWLGTMVVIAFAIWMLVGPIPKRPKWDPRRKR